MPSRSGLVGLTALLLSACLFESESPQAPAEGFAIHPDLSIGKQWMYQSLQYTEHADGSKSDSAAHFIHYTITGDTTIAGARYRVLLEEDLALFNTDYGLVKSQSAFAVLADSERIEIKALQGLDGYSGLFPFKTAADQAVPRHGVSRAAAFDTAHFRDEIIALQMPLEVGKGWDYRLPGSPSGIAAATKTFLGPDTLSLTGAKVPALKFQIQVENLDYFLTYEWYDDSVKVFSRTSSATSFEGKDSSRTEEEYLGPRYFTRADTLAVLKGAGVAP